MQFRHNLVLHGQWHPSWSAYSGVHGVIQAHVIHHRQLANGAGVEQVLVLRQPWRLLLDDGMHLWSKNHIAEPDTVSETQQWFDVSVHNLET